ncbi:MAG TPA: hypothetical protein DEH25_11625 [Chloroflexi bacterium]|nr:hypothetical protein [Chloroflexota bacterium]
MLATQPDDLHTLTGSVTGDGGVAEINGIHKKSRESAGFFGDDPEFQFLIGRMPEGEITFGETIAFKIEFAGIAYRHACCGEMIKHIVGGI